MGRRLKLVVNEVKECLRRTRSIIDSQKNPSDPLSHYIIVRKDLPLGNLAAQVTHAAGESSPGNLPTGTFAFVLRANNERHLRKISNELAAAGVPHKLIVEPDPPYYNEAMAIGVYPDKKSVVGPHLKELNLL